LLEEFRCGRRILAEADFDEFEERKADLMARLPID
jgi:hypothetical protein